MVCPGCRARHEDECICCTHWNWQIVSLEEWDDKTICFSVVCRECDLGGYVEYAINEDKTTMDIINEVVWDE